MYFSYRADPIRVKTLRYRTAPPSEVPQATVTKINTSLALEGMILGIVKVEVVTCLRLEDPMEVIATDVQFELNCTDGEAALALHMESMIAFNQLTVAARPKGIYNIN